MKEQKIIFLKRLFFVFTILATAAVLFFFLTWLYAPYDSSEAAEVFSYDIEKRLKLEEYAGNFCIQLLNSVVTSAKVCYEQNYGYPMPGLFASAFSNMTGGLHTGMSNPVTYLNIAFTAFSQYDPGTLPEEPDSITSFEDAPEGAIYFTEEDEYNAEDAQGQASTPTGQPSQINEENVPAPGKIEISGKSPQILIYHSHASESYMPNTADNYHTLAEKCNVISVGNILAKNLQDKYKYKVLHDTTYHDRPSYAYSYINSLNTVKKHIEKYDSIKVVLDIHRDAFNAEKLNNAQKTAKKAEYTTTINGKKAAKIMLVIGGKNPNYEELEKFAVYIKKKMDKLYPGLFMKITVAKNYKYNQYFRNHSMLVEVGCMLNTNEEAQYSAELLSKVLDEVIRDLKE